MMDTVKNRAKCFAELLNFDRYDWDNYHEEFVRTLVKFGYNKNLTTGENDWYKNEIKYGIDDRHIVDYTLPE